MSKHKKTDQPQEAPSTEATSAPSTDSAHEDSLIIDKRGSEFAEDLVYTLNHAIVCGASDVLDPFIGTWTQRHLGKKIVFNPLHDWAHEKFEHHDHDHGHNHHHDHGHDHHDHHDHGHGHGHGHHDHHHHEPSFWSNLSHWVVGEMVGDIGAVPFTLAMQHYTPGIMRGIQATTEPLLGGAFQWSANRYSQKWAYENGFDADSPETKARAEELYQHEVSHLPHAFAWTASAAGINIATQRLIGNKAPIKHLIAGKALGSIGTLGLVLTLRSLVPGKVQQLDEWNTEKLAKPITRKVSHWFGISDETIDRVFDQEREFEDGHHLLEKAKQKRKHKEDGMEHHDEPEKQVQAVSAHLMPPLSTLRALG